MPQQMFRRAFLKLIIFAAMLSVISLDVFGQSIETQRCAEGDYTCLIVKYDKEISSNPTDSDTYYRRGSAYLNLQKYERSIADFDMAISLNPKFADAYYARGYIYIQNKFYAAAIREFNRVKELDPKNSEAVAALAGIYEIIKGGGLPIEEYGNLIKLEPTKAEYYYGRARLHFKSKSFDLAIEDATKAIELNPKYTEAYAVRSDSYCKVLKSKESNADIARYEYLTGKKTKVVCKVCVLKPIDCQINDLTEKIVLEMKKESLKKLELLYYQRGSLYYGKGDYDSALADFNKIEFLPEFRQGLKYRGDIYLRKGKYDEALVDFIAYLSGDPASAKINLHVAEIYFTKRDYEKAFEYYDRVIFLSPGNTKAYYVRGTIYLERAENYGETGKDEIKSAEAYRKAVEDFDKVISKDSKDTDREVYLKRAKAYEKLGEREKADADRQKFRELTEKP